MLSPFDAVLGALQRTNWQLNDQGMEGQRLIGNFDNPEALGQNTPHYKHRAVMRDSISVFRLAAVVTIVVICIPLR
jgi:hypothetical protein